MRKIVVALVVIAMLAVMIPTAFATTESGGFMLEGGTPYEWTAEYTGTATLSGEPSVSIMVNNGNLGMGTAPTFAVTEGTTYTVQHFGDGFAWITWSIEVSGGAGDSGLADNQIAIESYGWAEFTAPETGTLKLTCDVDTTFNIDIGWDSYATDVASGDTIEVTAGTTYVIVPAYGTPDCVVTWEYVDGGEGGEATEPEKEKVDLTGTVVGACSGNAATAESYADFSWWSDGRPTWKPLGNFVDNDLTTYFSFGASAGERADLYLDLSNNDAGYTAVDEFTIYHSSQGDVPSVMVILILEDGSEWVKIYETNWVQFGGNVSITEVLDETKNAVGMYIWQDCNASWQTSSTSAHFGDIEIYTYLDSEGDTDTTVPSGSALALGDNNVTLPYANMPVMAPYWTYTATETGSLTVTVTSIDGNNMLEMAFGRGMYTLLVGETDGAYTNTATVTMTEGETVNIAVLNNLADGTAVINLSWVAGGNETPAEKNPADYFTQNPEGQYVIESLVNPVDIFVGNDDIYYIYTAEFAGTVTVTATVNGYEATNCWIAVNGDWNYSADPVNVSAGDVVLINVWQGYEGTVTLAIGEGGEGGGDVGGDTPTEKDPADYFEVDGDGNYIIESLPAEIFVGNNDINYIYTATEDGVVTVTPSVDGYTATNCWIYLNGVCDTSAAPVTVTAGDVVLINIWSGYEGTVTMGDGEGGEGGGEGGDQVEGLPSGSALALGDNNVSLTYATMPMAAPYWTYTATENGYLTVTVTSINGNTMLDMAFGRGMYTLLVGDTDGMGTNTATVYMNAGDTVNVAVLDTMDMEAVPAVLNVGFVAGEPVVEKDPADYFEVDGDGNYIIESLPANIFVGNDDIYYIYTATEDGTLTVTPTVEGYEATNCWITLNGDCNYNADPVTVTAGDTVLINIWSGYEGTVTLTAGEGGGNEGGEDIVPGEDVTVESGEGTISEIDAIEIFYTPTADGVLTVDISADPGFKFWVFEAATDASLTLPESGESGTYTYNLEAGVEYRVYIIGYYEHAESAAVITYDISFAAQEIEQPPVDIDKSEVVLELGDNNVDLLENTVVSLFDFVPAEPGVYTFTVPEGVTLAQYGYAAWNLMETAEGTSLTITATAAEQTIMIGLSGDVTSVNVNVEKTGNYTPPAQIEYEDYVPSNTVESDFEEPAGLEAIDITVEQNVVLGDDGYYHLGTADGPIVYVNLNNEQFTLALLYDAGAPITMRGTYVDEDGEEHPYDFMDMITSLYYNYSLENDYHPLNKDLMVFLKAYGTAQGWYGANTSSFESITSGDFNEDSAWLVSCYIVPETDEPTDDPLAGLDTTELEETLEAIESLDLDAYTEESLAALNAALEAYNAVVNDPNVDQDMIDEATATLKAAVAGLVLNSGDTGDDNTGDDTTGDDTTGDDTTGDDTTGDDTTGDDTTGDNTTGDDTTGDNTTGDDNTADNDVPADTGSIGILGAVLALAFSTAGGAAVIAKKKEF